MISYASEEELVLETIGLSIEDYEESTSQRILGNVLEIFFRYSKEKSKKYDRITKKLRSNRYCSGSFCERKRGLVEFTIFFHAPHYQLEKNRTRDFWPAPLMEGEGHQYV